MNLFSVTTKPFTLVLLLLGSGILGGCVSDTLGTADTRPTPQPVVQTAVNNNPNFDPVQRAQAVAEIRQKAANANSGTLTNAYAAADGPNEPLTPDASAAKIEQLRLIGERTNQTTVSRNEAELQAKKRKLRALQATGRNHYGQAISTIEQ